jgi:hypothetical protein
MGAAFYTAAAGRKLSVPCVGVEIDHVEGDDITID